MIVPFLLLPLLIGLGLTVALRRGRPRGSAGLSGWSRRLQGALGGVAATAVLIALSLGGGAGVTAPLAAVLVLVPGAGLLLLRRHERNATPVEGWAGPTGAAARSSVVVRRDPGSPVAVARSLARVEARELVASPWFGVGLGFCAVTLLLFGWVWAEDNVQSWAEHIQMAPWFANPMAGMAVLAGHRAVTRADRDGTAELFDSCPSAPATRTLGFLGASVAPVTALVVFVVAMAVADVVRSPLLHGPIGTDAVADLLGGVLLGAGGVALGVALGRWVRFTLAAVVALPVIAVAALQLNAVGGKGWNPLTPLSTVPAVRGPSPVFYDRPAWWHLLWIVALIAVVVVVAIARHRRDRAVALSAAMAVVLVIVAGVGATRPMSAASASTIADRVARPEADQVCRQLQQVELCTFRYHEEMLDRIEDRVAPIADVLPDAVPAMTFRQVYEGRFDALPPEVRRLLAPSDLERPEGEWPLTYGDGDVGFGVAFLATGLPPDVGDDLMPVVVAGEARGVVALWLATRGLDPADAAGYSRAYDPGSPDPLDRGSLEHLDDPCTAPSVIWSAQDLAAVRQVLTLSETEVLTVLADWDHWTDPSTGTDELLAALGLAPVGPFDQATPRPGSSC